MHRSPANGNSLARRRAELLTREVCAMQPVRQITRTGIVGFSSRLHGHTSTAVMPRTVTEDTRAVSGAEVSLLNKATGNRRSTLFDLAGDWDLAYSIPSSEARASKRKSQMRITTLFFAVLLLAWTPALLFAQSTAEIRGVVTDASG